MTFLRTDDDDLFPGENFWSKVPQHWIRDHRLTAMEFRVLIYWVSHRKNYRVSVEQTEAEIKEGRHAIYTAIKGLIAKGYIVRRQGRDDDGRRTAVEYTFGPAAFTQQYTRAWGRSDAPDVEGHESADDAACGQPGSGKPESSSTASSPTASRPTASREQHTKKNNLLGDQFFKEDQKTPPSGQPQLTDADAREAEKEEGEICSENNPASEDGPEPVGSPASPALRALVDEIRGHLPGQSVQGLQDALEAAVASGRSPVAVRAAALSLARGEHGPTKFAFKARLLSAGPWWETAAAAEVVAASARLAQADRCPTHRGQLAHNCSGCLANAKIPVEDREQVDPAPMAADVARAKAAAAIEAAKARRKGVGGGSVPVLPEPDSDPAVPRRTLTLVRGGAA